MGLRLAASAPTPTFSWIVRHGDRRSPLRALRNNGDGTFSDVTQEAGVDDPRWSTSAAFFDYDRDGHLDLFVANYLEFTIAGNKVCRAPTGETDYCTPRAYNPVTGRLFRNEGNGKFTDRSLPSRVGLIPGPGLGVMVSDVNQDGWPDIFVANDGAANFLWINQRDGTFRESGLQVGAAYSEDGMAKAGMGVTAGDSITTESTISWSSIWRAREQRCSGMRAPVSLSMAR